jgi:hypothetical protein
VLQALPFGRAESWRSGVSVSTDVSLPEAARHFKVTPETIRRWIRAGCPCVSPGEVGRGHGARLNIGDVARWRAARAGVPAVPDDLMTRIETAIVDTLRRDGGNGRPVAADLGLSHEQAATLLTHAYSRIRRVLGVT